MEVSVLRAGLHTTVQDLGRVRHRAAGVPRSGAMDAFALRIANALVGNADDAAGLEFTQTGPELEFSKPTWIALGGAECEGLRPWRSRRVEAGERLAIGRCVRGVRGYLAVAGGFQTEPVLGSRSTFLRGRFGGLQGRLLRDGDVLPVVDLSCDRVPRERPDAAGSWRIDPRILPAYGPEVTVRVLPGAQVAEFPGAWTGRAFKVSPHSDRMGVRLIGEPVVRSTGEELLSSAVTPGTVQVPPDGQPVVLMADAQTIGGYPQLGHVISVDLPLVAQLAPGDTLRFEIVTLAEAHRLLVTRERAIALLKQGLAEKLANEGRA